jgi:Aldehyde dehydrogenase family
VVHLKNGDCHVLGDERRRPDLVGNHDAGTPQRGDVPERGLLIGGKSVPASSGQLADDVCPWDGDIYARVAAGTPADITRAADAAQAAFPAWSAMGAFERREIFLRAADVIARRGEEAIQHSGRPAYPF